MLGKELGYFLHSIFLLDLRADIITSYFLFTYVFKFSQLHIMKVLCD